MGQPRLTRLDDALSGVVLLGFDSAPLIYFIERHPTYAALMDEIIGQLDKGQIDGLSSVITLTEVLVLPRRLGNEALVTAYRDLLLSSRHFRLIPIDSAVADRASELRARYHLRTPDALQVATAISAGCQLFITNDATLRRVTDLRILTLDEMTL